MDICAEKPAHRKSAKRYGNGRVPVQKSNDSDKNGQTKCECFAKLKELQAYTQANAFAAHLILTNRITRQVDGFRTL